jgi:hypothetical protein
MGCSWRSKSLSSEENFIRKLIIRALDDRLQNEISSVITATTENEHGFYINISRLEQLEKDETLLLVNGKSDDHIDKIGTNNKELKADLIKELTSKSLLQEEGVLIVVSDFVTKEVFREAKVWRGLSRKLKNEAWEAYERAKKSPPPEEFWRRKKLILVMLVLVTVILAMLLIVQSQRENPLFNPQHPQKEQKQTENPLTAPSSQHKEQKQTENPLTAPPSQHKEQKQTENPLTAPSSQHKEQKQAENPLLTPPSQHKEQKQAENPLTAPSSQHKEQKQAENPVTAPPSQHKEQSLMMSVPIKKTAKVNLQDQS